MKTAIVLTAIAALSGMVSGLAVNSTSDQPPSGDLGWPPNKNVTAASPEGAMLADGKVQLTPAAAGAYQKAKAFVAQMTNEEKIKMITAQSFTSSNVTWTALEAKDGSSGINAHFYVSGFVMSAALTMTWNRDLIAAQNKALGDEFYGMGYNLISGPVASPLGRNPYGGRSNEALSPDPYLSGIAMAEGIAAMNSAGVVSAGRHFLLYEQETNRDNGEYSSNADDKTLREVYLWPFADAVNSGMMAVMCGMNRVNGTKSCETDPLLNGALKRELGFPGLVFPDYGSQTSAYISANAGLDLGSTPLWGEVIMLAGLSRGDITEARLTDMAERNMMGYFYVGLDNGKQLPKAKTSEYRDVVANHSVLIRQAGGEAIILLKNDIANGGGLPLNKPRSVALFGAHAGFALQGPNQAFSVVGTPSDIFQGHLASGSGSGGLSLPYLITPIQSITARVAADKGMIWWISNNTYNAHFGSGIPGFPGGGGGGGFGPGGTTIIPSISSYASKVEVCIVFINSASGEGGDRHELSDVVQDKEVIEVAANCNNTIVVLNISGPRVLDAWIEHENITAVIYSGLLGQESGNAIADVLYGDVNPSGKLTHTIAKLASDYPTPTCLTRECDYTEGVYIDYRYFDAKNITVRYPFGHGLSYTSFTYGDVTTTVTNSSALASKAPTGPMALGGPSDLFSEVITATTTITNSGAVAGAEVAQLYLSFPAEAEQPIRVLRGFEKVAIPAGQSATVTFSLRRRDVSYWSTPAQQWLIASGDYIFSVGSSSQDIRGTTTLSI